MNLAHQSYNLCTVETSCFVVSLNSPLCSYCRRQFILVRQKWDKFCKYPSWQSIDQRERKHFNACSPEWAAVSQRTFSMLPPLSPQFINVGQVFLSESALKCNSEGFLKHSLKLHFVSPPPRICFCFFLWKDGMLIVFNISHVKQKKSLSAEHSVDGSMIYVTLLNSCSRAKIKLRRKISYYTQS